MNTTTALPMGCARCGVIRVLHDNDHRWQEPNMPLVLARAAAIKKRRAAA